MDTFSEFTFAYIFLSLVISTECSVASQTMALIGSEVQRKLSRSPALSGAHNFSNESADVGQRTSRGDLPRSIEMKDFAASNDSTSRDEPPEFSKPGAYNFAEEKWLHQDISYANYIKEVLGRKFRWKFSPKKKNHTVTTVFHKPETFEETKPVSPERLPIAQEEEEPSPITFAASPETVAVSAKADWSSPVNSTFENQLEEPNFPMASEQASEAETEYHSVSAASASREMPKTEKPPITDKPKETKFDYDDDEVPEKLKPPRVIELVVPEHLANDPDRILNAVDLERGYISRHFGFYNPEPENRQHVSNFINMIARESKGYEIRTARLHKRLFKLLTASEKISFCDENINGNVILRSKNLVYDEDADVQQSIKAVRKTVYYRWELPPETVTTIRCPIKAEKATKEKIPPAVYVVPVLYDNEYKSPYAFIFTDCTAEDKCEVDDGARPDRAVRLFALSRVDVDYVVDKITAELQKVKAAEKAPKAKVAKVAKKQTTTAEYYGKKSLLEPEERTTATPEEAVKDVAEKKRLIDTYLKDSSDLKVLKRLMEVLSPQELLAVQRKAHMFRDEKTKKKKKEPWLLKVVKNVTGIGKKSTPKADFYVDKAFSTAQTPALTVY